MLPIKVQCACGQRFAFDVEPLNGRMPSAVACPVCGADGTAAANQIIAQKLAAQPAMATAPVAAAPVNVAAAALAMPTARVAAPALARSTAAAVVEPDDGPLLKAPLPSRAVARRENEGEKWKWWYFVLAGVCIGGYSIWQAYDQHRAKPLGELFLAVFCIAIGIWDFQNKRKKRMRG